MKKKKITIQGVDYPVVFDMQAMLNFESIANKSFLGNDFHLTRDRIALIVGAVIAADEDTEITVEKVVGNKDFQAVKEIIEAYNTIMSLAEDFFDIPNVEPKDETQGEEEDKKN